MQRLNLLRSEWRLPGRIDGILGIAILLGVGMAPIPWVLEFTPTFSSPSRLALFTLAAACGATIGFLSLIDVYVLFGRDSLWRRFCWAVVIGAIPLLIVSQSASWIAQRGTQLFNVADFPFPLVLYAVLCQRWAATSCLLLLSVMLRTMTRWRVTFKHNRSPLEKESLRDERVTIAQLLSLTALLAISIVVVRHALASFPDQPGEYWSSFGRISIAIPHHGRLMRYASLLELSGLLLFVLAPLFLTRLLARMIPFKAFSSGNECFVTGAFAFGFFLIVAGAVGHYLTRIKAAPLLLDAAMDALFGFGLLHLLGRSFYSRWGIVVSTLDKSVANPVCSPEHAVFTGSIEEESSQPVRSFNPVFLAGVLITPALFGSFVASHDIPTWIRSYENAIEEARRVASISRALGEHPTFYHQFVDVVDWDLANGNARLDSSGRFAIAEKRFSVMDVPNLPASLFRAFSRYPGAVEVDVFDAQTLRAIAELQKVKWLSLDLHSLDHDAFRQLMETCEIAELRIHLMSDVEVDATFLSSLRAGRGIEKIHLIREAAPAIRLNPESMKQLGQLPIASLSCQFDSPEGIDFSGLQNLEWFVLHDSPLNTEVLSTIVAPDMLSFENCRLDRETILPLCDLEQTELVLMDTEISPEAIAEIATSELRHLCIDNSELQIDLQAAMALSDSKIKTIAIYVPNLEPVFVTKFNKRRGSRVLSAERNGDPLINAIANRGSVDLAVEALAHTHVRNDSGNLTTLDLQWYDFDDAAMKSLATITTLKRLRIDASVITDDIVELQNLESLELPAGWIPDSMLRQIGKLTKLKRLQLPPFPFCSVSKSPDIVEPEAIPFATVCYLDEDFHYMGAVNDGIFLYGQYGYIEYGAQEDKDDNLTAKGICELANLKDLEYLWIPGPLLHQDSIAIIERFPRLRELHALLSPAHPKILKRVAKLKNIEKLSIGVLRLDEPTKEIIRTLAHLETLQLYVMEVPMDEEYEPQRDEVEAELSALLPNTEIHLIVQPGFAYLIDSVRGR